MIFNFLWRVLLLCISNWWNFFMIFGKSLKYKLIIFIIILNIKTRLLIFNLQFTLYFIRHIYKRIIIHFRRYITIFFLTIIGTSINIDTFSNRCNNIFSRNSYFFMIYFRLLLFIYLFYYWFWYLTKLPFSQLFHL